MTNAHHASGIIAPEIRPGNTYGNAVVESGATAQFGNRYTNLHIHIENNSSRSFRIENLTASAAVGVIKEASDKLIKIISSIINISEPASILTELQFELNSTSIIIAGLETFLRCTNQVALARAALIPVQDVISVMTQLVLVYSELQLIVQRWQGPQHSVRTILRKSWMTDAAAVTKLQNRLQRHKLSLSLTLQIITWYAHI